MMGFIVVCVPGTDSEETALAFRNLESGRLCSVLQPLGSLVLLQMLDREKIQAELSDLSRQQLKAVKDATYLGWRKTESAAYDKRVKRIACLYARLAEIDPRSSISPEKLNS
jgi:hypothetical protein